MVFVNINNSNGNNELIIIIKRQIIGAITWLESLQGRIRLDLASELKSTVTCKEFQTLTTRSVKINYNSLFE